MLCGAGYCLDFGLFNHIMSLKRSLSQDFDDETGKDVR